MSERTRETVSVSAGPIETVERQTEVTVVGMSVEADVFGDKVRLAIKRSVNGVAFNRGSMKLTSAQAMALAGQLVAASALVSAVEAQVAAERVGRILDRWDAAGDTDACAPRDGDAS